MTADAYPLNWPPGWPRTAPDDRRDGRHQFRRPTTSNASPWWTFEAARDALLDELHRLGARDLVISSNIRPDRLGMLIEPSRRPLDQGLAVYFMLHRRPMVMARDSYLRIEENMRALTLTIEAMRAIERHGGGTMLQRAFDGFAALPPPLVTPPRPNWWDILGVTRNASADEIRAAYRAAAKRRHPDCGGNVDDMAELQAALEDALSEVAS